MKRFIVSELGWLFKSLKDRYIAYFHMKRDNETCYKNIR